MRLPTLQATALLLVAAFANSASAQTPPTATFIGKVFADTSMRLIPGVEVKLPTLDKTAITDAKGAFRFVDVPVGTHVVQARAVGYVPFEAAIEFKKGQIVERGIVLPRLTILDSVRVVGEMNVPLSFLENRHAGLGHFMTREDLEKVGNRALADVLAQTPGLAVIRGTTGQGYLLSKRAPAPPNPTGRNTVGTDIYYPTTAERSRGIQAGCYARVYLDGQLLNPTTPADPVNVNDFGVRSIEATEYYASPAQTPSRYSRLNSTCGVFVIHTRRSP